jgi:hypothetical protein
MKALALKIVNWILQTYILWCLILIGLNIEFWWFPIFPFGVASIFYKFIKFSLPVIAITSCISITAFLYIHRKYSILSRWFSPIIANGILWVSFFLVGELYKDILMAVEANQKNAECIHIHSLLRSVHRAGEFSPEHAYIIVGGKVFFWSYSQLSFVESDGNQPRSCGKNTFTL